MKVMDGLIRACDLNVEALLVRQRRWPSRRGSFGDPVMVGFEANPHV